ncbi:MAG: hypothetical protein IAB19_03200 [Proteobacteria bacterium]|uniref:Uncharacterized protein n=1 Tax=Candidatus Avisuccinivibrio stercorigallinarum TaxID=2840704 RepID=A0A9D9GNT2_9GAMM|nr:hypothetical protein [Candidatus Avisuccinivibrio stercorigallinarum]
MTEPQNKQETFSEVLSAVDRQQQGRKIPLELLIGRILACKHCTLGRISLDAIEPIPADLPADDKKPEAQYLIAGKLLISWYMHPEESHDGAQYELRLILPYQCWEGPDDLPRLRAHMPLCADEAALLRSIKPVILRNEQVYFAFPIGESANSDLMPRLDWKNFERLESPADQDYERLELAAALLSGTDAECLKAAETMLDENCCPDARRQFDDFLKAHASLTARAEALLQKINQQEARAQELKTKILAETAPGLKPEK